MVRVLSETAIKRVLDIETLLPVVEEALVKQARGAVERPDRPHFPVGTGLDGEQPHGTAITMPAYIHGDDRYATKLVSVNEGNESRGLPTLHAQILLTDARTGVPVAFMGATTVTNARTGCIGALAVRDLASEATTLSVLGAGAQARWQARAIDAVADLSAVRIYSPSDSRTQCVTDLQSMNVPATAVDSPEDAVEAADVVVTATTSAKPVFPADALAPGALVVAVGAYTPEMQEVDSGVFERASEVIADVPEEVATIGDLLATDLAESDLVALGSVLAEGYVVGPDETIVVESVGSAVLDAAAGQAVYEAAGNAGTDVSLE